MSNLQFTGHHTVECDEMWSFVELKRNKRNKQRIWLALDSDSRKIVGMHVGSCDRAGAEALWKSFFVVSFELQVGHSIMLSPTVNSCSFRLPEL